MAEFKSVSMTNPQTVLDTFSSPPFTAVGEGLSKQVLLDNGANLTIKISPSTATLQVIETPGETGFQSRQLTLQGGAPCTAIVQAVGSDGSVAAQLDVAVKARKTLSVAFTRIIPTTGERSIRERADVVTLMLSPNRIITPQTNVAFTLKSFQDASVPLDLTQGVPWVDDIALTPKPPLQTFHFPGNPVACVMRSRPNSPFGCDPNDPTQSAALNPADTKNYYALNTWSAIFSHPDTFADINVFLVRRLDVANIPGGLPSVGAFTVEKSIIFPDLSTGLPLSHAICHTLLGPGHFGDLTHQRDRRNLMDPTPGANIRLVKEQINQINP